MIGSILVKIAFASILVCGGCYAYVIRKNEFGALQVARYAYNLTVACVLSFCAFLLYLILTHQFQYTYVWNYSSTDLPTPLLISTFYAGQEGSFTLWTLYTSIIGIILLHYTSKRGYEAEVMVVWSMILTFLLTMLVVKNPFMLIWESFPKDLIHTGPITADTTNYQWLDQAKGIWAQYPAEGKGLNPLLQNYWMVIHPQILFTGFSSMAVPYTFAVAGLLRRDYQSWVKIAKPWIVFSTAILGTGIILGGYWAYETLGWGGYWGWDPVENSSLIPWLVGVSSIHTMMSQRRSGTFVRTNFVLSIMCFIMVLYSTFLTRSGVLGETSVHSFVDPGMWAYWILLGVIVIFGAFGFGLLFRRWKEMPRIPVEHTIYSREFALFLGAFTLCFAAIFITIGTSSPIITNILKGKAAAVDTSYYVTTILPLGIVIAFLAGIGQLLWWKSSNTKEFFQNLTFPVISTVIFTIGTIILGVHDIAMIIFVFASAFTLFINIMVGYRIFKGNPKFVGGAIAHIGVALLFLGFVASSKYDEKQTVSLEAGKPSSILGGYTLTYLGNRALDAERYGFDIEVQRGNAVYTVVPVMRYSNSTQSMMRHPDILNMYTSDFYVSPLSVESPNDHNEQTLSLLKGETKELDSLKIRFVDFDFSDVQKGNMLEGGSFSIGVQLTVTKDNLEHTLNLVMKNDQGSITYVPAHIEGSTKEFTIATMHPDRENPARSSVEIGIKDMSGKTQQQKGETLIVEATVKPYINLVWMGTVTLLVGFILTIIRRIEESMKRGD